MGNRVLTKVEYTVTGNDVRSSVVRLTDVQAYIPHAAYINEGKAPDPYNPPKGTAPITIDWGGQKSLHFVSKPHGHAPKPRNEAVANFFATFEITAGSKLSIEVLLMGELRITKLH